MKRLSKEKLTEIVRKSMPGSEVVDSEPVSIDGPLPSQMRSVGLSQIQRKLAKQVKPYMAPEDVLVTDDQGEDVVQAVEVVLGQGRRERKTVLVSSAKEQIIGKQG